MSDSEKVTVSKKFWKASHGAWYVKLIQPNGSRKDRRLKTKPGLSEKQAEDAAEGIRQKLIEEFELAGRPTLDCTVDHLIQLFLAWVEANNEKATFKWYLNFLKSFGASLGKSLRVRDLRLGHVQTWLSQSYPQKSNQNTRHNAIACVKRLFNWATKEMEYFDRNPLAALKKPQRTHRDVCPTHAQWEQVFAHYSDPADPFRLFLEALVATGCRPQELRGVEARHIDFDAGLIRFADGDIPGKKYGRDVILTEHATAILKPLALARPEGKIFRNADGNPWTKDALNNRFQRLKKEKFPFKVNCYAARHSKATDLLENGASTGAVAALLGHRDPTVVLKFYGKHIDQRADHLRGLMEKADPESKPDQDQKPGTLPITEEDVRAAQERRERDAG